MGSSALPKVFMGSIASLGRGNGTRTNALFKVRIASLLNLAD